METGKEVCFMLCTNCKKNQATVYYSQNINGKKSEQALCPACYEKLKASADYPDFGDLLGSLFAPKTHNALRSSTVKACTLCGSTWRDLRQSGKVGCAKCYEVFRDELESTVQSIHGRTAHVGRHPVKQTAEAEKAQETVSADEKDEKKEQKKRISAMKKELDQAIREQNFEEAARLRDLIRDAENGKEGR